MKSVVAGVGAAPCGSARRAFPAKPMTAYCSRPKDVRLPLAVNPLACSYVPMVNKINEFQQNQKLAPQAF